MAELTNINRTDIVHRFGYHKATDLTAPMHQDVRNAFIEFANHLNEVLPDSRAKSVAFTELESSSMWANKAISGLAPMSYDQTGDS